MITLRYTASFLSNVSSAQSFVYIPEIAVNF